MPEHIQYEDDDLFNPETHHEHSDVPVRPLFVFIVVFIIFGVVSHVGLYLLYKGFAKAERSRMDPPQTQVSRPVTAVIPQNQPLLEPFPHEDTPPYKNTPVTDLAAMRESENAVLHHYGWVDKEHGVVHMPIDVAKSLFAARGAMQSQPAPAAAPQGGALASSPAGPAPSPAPTATTTGGAHQ